VTVAYRPLQQDAYQRAWFHADAVIHWGKRGRQPRRGSCAAGMRSRSQRLCRWKRARLSGTFTFVDWPCDIRAYWRAIATNLCDHAEYARPPFVKGDDGLAAIVNVFGKNAAAVW